MSKTIKLKAAKGVNLMDMKEDEIRKLVEEQADVALKQLPRDLRFSDVNSIMLESNPAETQAIGGWAKWTRACCDKRRRIEDFVNPTLPELTDGISGLERTLKQDHFDSNLSKSATVKGLKTKRKATKKLKTTAKKKRK